MMQVTPPATVGGIEGVMSVKKEYLYATFNAIKKQYRSVDNFLKAQMGLSADDLKTLRKKYLD